MPNIVNGKFGAFLLSEQSVLSFCIAFCCFSISQTDSFLMLVSVDRSLFENGDGARYRSVVSGPLVCAFFQNSATLGPRQEVSHANRAGERRMQEAEASER